MLGGMSLILRDFIKKHAKTLNSTERGIYNFIERHRDRLIQAGIIRLVEKMEAHSISVENEEKLLEYIYERRMAARNKKVLHNKGNREEYAYK